MNRLKKAGRIFFKTILIILVIIFTCLLAFDVLVQFRDSDDKLLSFFQQKKIHASIGYYTSQGRTLRHIAVGNPSAPVTILFIHGAPSSMSYFKNYFSNDSLLKQAYMIAVDRPGYGYSGFGNPETSLALQSQMIRPLLDSLHPERHPLILVGVSYGSSLAARMTMDYPDLVDGLVLVAPSLAPGEEKIFSIAYPIELPFFKWAIPRMFISANAEKLSHRSELQQMMGGWSGIKIPVMYLQGKNDELIYTTNASFARNKLTNAACLTIDLIPNRGHLIMFAEIRKIKEAIVEMTQLAGTYYDGAKRKNIASRSEHAGYFGAQR